MPDPLRKVLDALVGVLPPDCTDPVLLADLLWLATSRGGPPEEDGPPTAQEAGAETPPATAGAAAGPEPDARPAAPQPPTTGPNAPSEFAYQGPYGLYEDLSEEPGAGIDASSVVVAAGRALPRSVELGRALRPFMRPFPNGRRTGLDLAATIDSYARNDELLPVLRPLPERWFEVLLVVDTHLSMEVWQDAVHEFSLLLENSGAFRRVQRWHLSTEPHPDVTDARGRVVNSRNVAAPDGRRLVLVVSDCAAPAWYGREVWQLLRDWAGQCPVSIASPLPSRLWHRTGLDLPAVRVRGRLPGVANTALAVSMPPHLRGVLPEGETHVPIPTLTLTAHSLDRWAKGVLRCSPEGYEAVLVTPFGPPEDHVVGGPDGEEEQDTPAPWLQVSALAADAFIRTASLPAVRLGGLCSAFRRLSVPLIQLIRQEVVQDATNSDIAELLMSDVLDIGGSRDDPTITFREAARAPLARTAGRHDAWRVLDALSHHISQRVPLPGRGLNAIAALDTADLPGAVRPFAYASAELVAALRAGAPHHRSGPGGTGVKGGASGEEVRLLLPDPLRSAAVLIESVSADEEDGPANEVSSALARLSSLLTSPEGWNLPAERCVRLTGARTRHVREALREAAAMAPDVLLVWYVGGHGPRGGPRDGWMVGPGGEPLRPAEELAALDVAQLVVVEDGCAADPSRGPRPGTTWLAYEPARTEEPLGLTRQLLRTIDEGMPGAPPLLTVAQLVRAVPADAEGWLPRLTLTASSGSTVLALARNRAATLPAVPVPPDAAAPPLRVTEASVTRLLSQMRPELRPADADERSVAAAEQVLEALLGFLHTRMRNPRPDRSFPQGAEGGSFRAELVDSLAPYGVTVSEGPGFSTLLRAPQTHETTVIPTEVLNLSDHSRWSRPSFSPDVSRPLISAPFALLLVLEGNSESHDRSLAERVGITRKADACLVTLHFPGAPSSAAGSSEDPAGEPPPGVEEAVGTFCAQGFDAGVSSLRWRRFQDAVSLARIAPRELSEHHVLSVRPDLANLRLPQDGTEGGRVRVPATLELAGLWPTARLSPAPGMTVLSTSEQDTYSFVAVDLAVVLVFETSSSEPLGVTLHHVESATP
ncbi:SAV_2336 N-terminal domain-related protein [Streptomyces erythrochromogenes]|uniref:SAV_2336 N-terminal domain-related protein n=1 Tax=Streptomyces erythrochromogenes TaxID=285574 RepID=UPI0037F84E33